MRMKIFSSAKPLSPAVARNCFLLNQFATPGLGSLLAGRIVAGLGQLFLALIGFALVLVWFALTMKAYYSLMTNDTPTRSYLSYALAGAFVFAASWLWSLLTSLSLLRATKLQEPLMPDQIPPRITNGPPKM